MTNHHRWIRAQIKQMCRWLQVSTSGFHDWVGRGLSPTQAWRHELGLIIDHIFASHDGTFGYRRVHAALARMGRHVDPETVRSIMRARGLVACQPRAKRRCATRRAKDVCPWPWQSPHWWPREVPAGGQVEVPTLCSCRP